MGKKSSLESALQSCRIPCIAITGTNGKSTVAKMTERMLSQSGKKVFLGGGSFEPYENLVRGDTRYDLAVLELSSATLEKTESFHPKIAVITNLVPAHFERHTTHHKYFEIKGRIFAHQTVSDLLIYNADNSYVRDLVKKARAKLFPVSTSPLKGEGAWYETKQLIYSPPGGPSEVYSTERMLLKGEYQVMNFLCALSAARLMGASSEAVRSVIETFEGLPHRMQKCFQKEGLTFYDDSRSSNPASTAWGLNAFPEPVIWIGGGLDYEADYKNLAPSVKKRVKLMILTGENRERMHSFLKDLTETYWTATLEEAVKLARKMAKAGDAIVYSPAAPPEPHLFEGFAGRGQRFLEILKVEFGVELEKKRRADSTQPGGIKI